LGFKFFTDASVRPLKTEVEEKINPFWTAKQIGE